MTIDIIGLFDSLLDASYRGIAFSVIDTRLDVGRRMQRQLFPGLDAKNFQDLGALDGPIHVTGLISGDDYVAQGQALYAAFRTSGPATLVLPWMQASQVILMGTASISYTHTELRIVRFTATFELYLPAAPVSPDTLQQLLAQVSALRTQARAWLANLLAPLVLPLAVFGYSVSFVSQMASYWTALTQGGVGLDILGPAAAPAITLLAANPQSYGSTWASATVAAIAGVPDAIQAAAVPTPPAAIGPGQSAVTPVAADPRDATNLLLAGSSKIGTTASNPAPAAALATATQAIILSDALSAASDIVYTSQQDAIAWRTTLLAALDAAIAAAANLAAADPAGAAPTWRALLASRTAWLADINAEIGRLPPVITIELPTTMPAWLVAQYLSGDTPASVRTTYLNVVARNRVRNPAVIPAGTIEVLG